MLRSLVLPAMPTVSKAVTGRNCLCIPGMIQLSGTLGNIAQNSPVSTIIYILVSTDLFFHFFALAYQDSVHLWDLIHSLLKHLYHGHIIILAHHLLTQI